MSEIRDLSLHHGDLRFSARVAGEGPLVLCVHGFPDTVHSFDHQLPALAAAGYRAVSVALRGYEPSSQPAHSDYSLEALAGDIRAFLDELGAERAHLVGHDWGAAVVYTSAVAMPERIASISVFTLPHPARFLARIFRHPRQLGLSWYMLFFQLPWLSDYWVRRRDFRFLRWLWRRWSPTWHWSDSDWEQLRHSFSLPGVVAAALAYYRLTLSSAAADRLRGTEPLGVVPVPTLAMAGESDGCIDARVFEAMMFPGDFPAGLRLERIPGAGHFLHREVPDTVNALLLEWLDEHAIHTGAAERPNATPAPNHVDNPN